jgi:hypothetical protein
VVPRIRSPTPTKLLISDAVPLDGQLRTSPAQGVVSLHGLNCPYDAAFNG